MDTKPRQRKGIPIGGQYASTSRPASGLGLLDRGNQAWALGEEAERAGSDLVRAEEQLESATDTLMLIELGRLAELATDSDPDTVRLELAAYSDGGLEVTQAWTADGAEVYQSGEAPAYLVEDLATIPGDAHTLLEATMERHHALLTQDRPGIWTLDVPQARRQHLATRPGAEATWEQHKDWSGAPLRARRAHAEASRAVTLATVHQMVAHAVAADTRIAGLLVAPNDDGQPYLAGYTDRNQQALTGGDGEALETGLDAEVEAVANRYRDRRMVGQHRDRTITTRDLHRAGLLPAAHLGPQGYVITLDRVRRARGVADDPNQPDLLGLPLSSYGYTGIPGA